MMKSMKATPAALLTNVHNFSVRTSACKESALLCYSTDVKSLQCAWTNDTALLRNVCASSKVSEETCAALHRNDGSHLAEKGFETTDFSIVEIPKADLASAEQFSLLEVDRYCEQKLNAFYESFINDRFLRELWVLGFSLSEEILCAAFISLNLEFVCDDPIPRSGKDHQRARHPVLRKATRSDGVRIWVLITPPGRGITRMYTQALHRVLPKILPEQLFELRAFVIPEIANSVEGFKVAFGVDAELEREVNGHVVVVGGRFCCSDPTDDTVHLMQSIFEKNKGWSPAEKRCGVSWCLQSFTHSDRSKICFLGWKPSFFGDLAYGLGAMLAQFRVQDLLHVGSKVGSTVSASDKELVETWSPDTFFIVDEQGELQSIECELAFSDFPHDRDGRHVSIPNPLDESRVRCRVTLKKSFSTIDDEGSQFAKAAAETDGRMRFDALYWVSDYIKRDHEFDGGVLAAACLNPDPNSVLSAGLKQEERRREILKLMSDVLRKHMNVGIPRSHWLGHHPGIVGNALFAREKIIDELSTTLLRDRFVYVIGMIGVGKTAIMAKLREETSRAYPGGIWWFDAASLVTSERDLAIDLNLVAYEEIDDNSVSKMRVITKEEIRKKLRHSLSSKPRKTLLIFDNVDDMVRLEELTESWLDTAFRQRNQHIFISVIGQVVPSRDVVKTPFMIHNLCEENSWQMLLRLASETSHGPVNDSTIKAMMADLPESEQNSVKLLANDKLGGNPLAIKLLAGAKCDYNSWAELGKKWVDPVVLDMTYLVRDPEEPVPSNDIKRYQWAKRVIGTSIDLSLQALRGFEYDFRQSIFEFLEKCALWGGDGLRIPLQLVANDRNKTISLMNILRKRFLVNNTDSNDFIQMHSLVAEGVWILCKQQAEIIQKAMAFALTSTIRTLPVRDLKKRASIVLVDTLIKNGRLDNQHCGETVLEVLDCYGWFAIQSANMPAEAERILTAALKFGNEHDRAGNGRRHANLGKNLMSVHQFKEARSHLESALSIQSASLPQCNLN